VKNFTEFRKSGKGLLLHGTVGTGKTYFAACVANSLLDDGYSVLMTNFARLTNQIQGMFEGKQEFIDSLNRYSLLILDDLGAERKSEYMQEMVFNIIDSRYRAGLPMIITTNLTIDEIKKPQEVSYSRIYDRIIERCFPVEVSGNSRRRQNVRDSYFETKKMLGL
jgi:DNA replication protein DnaC